MAIAPFACQICPTCAGLLTVWADSARGLAAQLQLPQQDSPSLIISHELSLEEAPDAYKHFDQRDKGWTKVVLHPNGM